MLNFFLISESLTSEYKTYFLTLISLVSILSAIFVIISKNPIVSVLFLIILFSTIAVYLITLGLTFIGLSYLLVYVGAVSILFLFILMLINVRVSELITDTGNSIPLGILTVFIITSSIYYVLPYDIYNYDILYNIGDNNIFDSGLTYSVYGLLFKEKLNKSGITSGDLWDGNVYVTSHITSIGNTIYSSFSIWLIIVSLILLLAMIGAIVVTVRNYAR